MGHYRPATVKNSRRNTLVSEFITTRPPLSSLHSARWLLRLPSALATPVGASRLLAPLVLCYPLSMIKHVIILTLCIAITSCSHRVELHGSGYVQNDSIRLTVNNLEAISNWMDQQNLSWVKRKAFVKYAPDKVIYSIVQSDGKCLYICGDKNHYVLSGDYTAQLSDEQYQDFCNFVSRRKG